MRSSKRQFQFVAGVPCPARTVNAAQSCYVSNSFAKQRRLGHAKCSSLCLLVLCCAHAVRRADLRVPHFDLHEPATSPYPQQVPSRERVNSDTIGSHHAVLPSPASSPPFVSVSTFRVTCSITPQITENAHMRCCWSKISKKSVRSTRGVDQSLSAGTGSGMTPVVM